MKGSPTARFSRVNTDSRQARAGDLFIALSGERFDGPAFVAEVAAKGAAAVVIERGHKLEALPEGVGFELGWAYLGWILGLLALYPLCKWFGDFKRAHPKWRWLSFF